jgi:hypothetical protein
MERSLLNRLCSVIDLLSQVLTNVSSSAQGSVASQFVACNIEPAFSFRNLTPICMSATIHGSISSVSFSLPPGGLIHSCSSLSSKNSVSMSLKFDSAPQPLFSRSRVEIDLLGSQVAHPVDVIALSSDDKFAKDSSSAIRLIIERIDGSEHVVYAPYWVVNRTGIPVSFCVDGKPHEAHIDSSVIAHEDVCSALPCQLTELMEKRAAKLVMWGFSSAEDGRGGRLKLSVSGADWSRQSFAADQLGEIGCLELALCSSPKSSVISVAIYSHVCAGAFWRSRTITLLPRHVLYNGTDENLEVLTSTPEGARFKVKGVDNSPYPSTVVPSKGWVVLLGAPGQDAAQRNIKLRPHRLGKSFFRFSPTFNPENFDGFCLRCRSAESQPHEMMNGNVFVDMGNPNLFPPSFNVKVDIKGSYGLVAAVVSTVGWQVYRVTNRSFYFIMFHQQSVPVALADIVLPGATSSFALDDVEKKGDIVEVIVLAGPNQKALHVFKINFFSCEKSALNEMTHGDIKVSPSIQDGIYSMVIEPCAGRSAATVSQLRNIGSGLTHTFLSATSAQRAIAMPDAPVASDISVAGVNANVSDLCDEDSRSNAAPSASGGGEAAPESSQADQIVCDKRIDVKVAGIGISIIDDSPSEILYISVLGVKYTRYSSMGLDMHEIYLRRLQIDANEIIVVGHTIIPPNQLAQLDPAGILQIANDPIEPSALSDADAASVRCISYLLHLNSFIFNHYKVYLIT